MINRIHGVTAITTLASAVLVLAACSSTGAQPKSRHSASSTAKILPVRIMPGPKKLTAMAAPQANEMTWALAGAPSSGLYRMNAASGHLAGSVAVSDAARSVAESAADVIGLALGTSRSGALQLLDGRTAKVIRTVPLPAPARQVAAGNNGTTFYVLTAWPKSASVTIVNPQDGKINGSVPVPADTVSIAPDTRRVSLYALQANGLVDDISITSGKITAQFRIGDAGEWITMSPDGSTLYILKGSIKVSNVAVVNVSTESMRRVLPSPSDCRQVLVSASGTQLYEVVGTPSYGNIQVFSV